MKNKIIKDSKLPELRKKFKRKKIVLVHGVFDVVHRGHVEYFKEAKSKGDLLVVSITIDKHVNKGINRPYFNSEDRSKFLSEFQIIDYVVLSKNKSSINIIKKLKPDFYIKGPDYKTSKNDKAGNLKVEKKTVEKYGGRIFFTSGVQFSSTKIINKSFDEFKKIPEFLKMNRKKNLNKEIILSEFKSCLKKVKNQKILIIGEIVIDNYLYSKPLGTPSKENILSVNFIKKKEFIGGSIPILNNLSEVFKNITFVSLFKSKSFYKKIKKSYSNKAKLHLIYDKNFKEIKKNRYIDINNNRKFFEFYDFYNKEFYNQKLLNFLKKETKKFDKVIVCDFGHGMITDQVVKILENNSKFLCINVQTNSGNRGYNLFTKFSKADLLVLDEPEIRLGLSYRYKSFEKIIYDKKLNNYKNLMVTLGVKGLALRLNKEKNFLYYPAFSSVAIDTLGAGDAAYSYSSMFIDKTKNNNLIGFLSSIAGGIKTKILGHSKFINLDLVKNSLENLLK